MLLYRHLKGKHSIQKLTCINIKLNMIYKGKILVDTPTKALT